MQVLAVLAIHLCPRCVVYFVVFDCTLGRFISRCFVFASRMAQAEITVLMDGLTAILQDPRICKKNPDETQKFKLLSEYAGYVALFL